MEEQCTLNLLPIGKKAIVNSVECAEKLKTRLYDFGILFGSEITPVYRSPFGDPTAYIVKNAVVALRRTDSSKINVTPKN